MHIYAARQPRLTSYQHCFASSDLDETCQYIGEALKPHQLTLLDRSQSLHANVGRTNFGHISFMYIHHGADVYVYPGKLEKIFIFQVPINTGDHCVRVGENLIQVVPGTAYMVSPTLDLELRMSRSCDNFVLALDRQYLEQHLEQQLQRRLDLPLEFVPRVELYQPASRELVDFMFFLTHQFNSSSTKLRDNPMRTQVESLFSNIVLTNLMHNYREELVGESVAPRPRYIKRAEEYIRANAHLSLTPQDIAKETNVSLRSIYAGFRLYLHCTPMAYVKNVRLEKINRKLQCEDAGVTVAQLTSQYGFGSSGNFAASYRHRFGELPSETIQKQRRR